MRTIVVLSILVRLTGVAAAAAPDDRGRCADGVALAGAKLASASLKLLAHCRKDGTGACSLATVSPQTALARGVLKARQYSATAVRRACRSVSAEQFPITTCPTHHPIAIPDVGALASCVQALVERDTQGMLGELLGLPPICGDGIRATTEECDGGDDDACPGHCGAGCVCDAHLGACVGGAGYGSCRNDEDCAGRCNLNGEECFVDADCHADTCGRCSQTNETCETGADCVQNNVCATNFCVQNTCNEPCDAGRCMSGRACTTDADCPIRGYCPSTIETCSADRPCPAAPGFCNITGDVCTTSADCGAARGYCTTTGEPCATSAECAPNACRTDVCRLSGHACTTESDCGTHCAGVCLFSSIFLGTQATCQTADDCPRIDTCTTFQDFCSNGTCVFRGGACATDTDCPPAGSCRFSGDQCQSDDDCPNDFRDYCEFFCEGTQAYCTTDADCSPRCSYPAPGFCLN